MLAAFCLIANAAVETRAQHVKLGFAHRAFETEQKAIVEEPGMIDAVGIANERVGQASEVDETVPIGVIAGEPRDLEAEHKTHPCECYFGGEVSKARSLHRAVTGEAEILVDDNDSILRPTELTGLGRERILPLRRFAIVLDLSGARLTQIDDSLARQVARGDCVKKTRKRHAVGEMRDDPSESPCRRRLQTAMSCFGQKPRW